MSGLECFFCLMLVVCFFGLVLNYFAQILWFCAGALVTTFVCSSVGLTSVPYVTDVLSLIVGVAMFKWSLDRKWFDLDEFCRTWTVLSIIKNLLK